ncbi:hypothetical protein F5Y00DRAFT_264437 [Daldinia vernicosa]|uniref:uncharacterized protein n=1 Tax=Daldinia vernicosa TaxID=114800 RepID=UPI002008C064|nr:uncharacterized protein F5Y00DRAFT_264437 [Daldinia vernicosa]KAI0846625.1 hypothetical protein F5Y00DRAFT_264437 [Daldinia vernicosa]
MSTTTDTSTVKLLSPDNWEYWETAFKAKTVSANIWHKICPGGDIPIENRQNQWLLKPIKPILSNYSKPRNAQDRQNDIQTASDLTQAQQSSFTLDFNIYKENMKDYDTERTSIEKMKSWIQ